MGISLGLILGGTSILVVFGMAVLLPTYFVSATVDQLDSTENPNNPFGGAYEGPPQIIMISNNTEYNGILDSYSFEKIDTLGELPVSIDKVTSPLPNQSIAVKKGSIIEFAIKGNAPPEAQSDTLAVNAYRINGNPIKVLEVADESQKTSFVVNLDEGTEYILMAIATWLPQETAESISGYVSYNYRLNVVA